MRTQIQSRKTVMIHLLFIGLFLLNSSFGATQAQGRLQKAAQLISDSRFQDAIHVLESFIESNPPAPQAPLAPHTWKPLAEAHFLLAKIYFITIKLEHPSVEENLKKCFKMNIDFEAKTTNKYFNKKMEEIRNNVQYMEYENEEGFLERRFIGGIVMVHIPAGKFKMGSRHGDSDERPPHDVFLDSYWIGKYEVTIEQYKTFISESGHRPLPSKIKRLSFGDQCPVIGVSWNDAAAYCQWLTKKTGKHFTLPTEAQWEKAARGGKKRKYPWGDQNPNCSRASFRRCPNGIVPVESKSPGKSLHGAYQMAGNVYEWCRDWYHPNYYSESPPRNPEGPGDGEQKTIRGGGFRDSKENLRSTNRKAAHPTSGGDDLGFRLCLVE